MKHLDLFSGIGGFALAARWVGWETVQFVEIDKFCQKVLNKNFPNIPIHGDIKTFNSSNYRGTIDILSGGFPCQPFSNAGRRKGKEDDRYLWPEMLRIIREIQPVYIVGENVRGLTNWNNGLVFNKIQADLEIEGYEIAPFLLSSCAVGTSHDRARIWFVAHLASHSDNKQGTLYKNGKQIYTCCIDRLNIRSEHNRNFEFVNESKSYEAIAPIFCGKNDGVPNRVDRIRALGNSIVPQVAFEIFKAIELTK